MIPIVYYAHSKQIYGTAQEKRELETIQMCFYHDVIFNPNRPSIQFADDPMQVCIEKVKDPSITALIFSEFQEVIEAGVYAEIQTAKKYGKPIFFLNGEKMVAYLGGYTPVDGGKYRREL